MCCLFFFFVLFTLCPSMSQCFLLLLLNVAEIIQMCLPVCFFICLVCKQSLAQGYKDVILYSLHETVFFTISNFNFHPIYFKLFYILITHLLHIIYATRFSISHYFLFLMITDATNYINDIYWIIHPFQIEMNCYLC